MSYPKQLHVGENIADLEKLYMTLPPDIKDRELDIVCKSARKLIEQSERHYINRDEELAYVGYMRLMNVVQVIRRNKDYARKKEAVTRLLGTQKDFVRIFEKLEKLKDSLETRYQERARQKAPTAGASRATVDAGRDAPVAFVPPAVQRQTVNATELHAMLNDCGVSMLIMDCRPSKDFEASHLRYSFLVNVPEHLLVPGMTAGKINHALPAESRTLWSNRMVKDQVLLMDWSTSGAPVKDTPIYILNYILCHYDQDIEDTKIIRLDGGYESFLLHYPASCSNPSYRPPTTVNGTGENIDDIEYPNISDIPMKEESFTKPGFKPTIDRNSKVAAVTLYEARKKPLEDILVEHEQILDKSKQNALEIINTETELKNLEQQQPLEPGVDETQESLLFEVMQLKDRQRDYEAEKARILEEEEKYKELEKEQKERGEQISTERAEQLEREAYERRLREKEREQRELEEKCQRLAREREAKLALAREQKRLLKENIPEPAKRFYQEDDQQRPAATGTRLPLFDRSAKPLADHNQNLRSLRDLDVVQRDFAPVYGSVGRGLTGLKNLGNTCYMNSILQCLSNTYFLNEFFHDPSFKMHLNRNNKTQGKIGEEVAAVIKALWTGQYKCIASKNLRYVVGQYERQFGGIEQQDSHEFLTILMDWLHSDLQTKQMQISTSLDQLPPSEKAWIEHFKGKGSYISELFYGQIKSTVKCTRCHKESATYESFSNLSLELPQDSNICYLENCLDMYFNGEEVRGWHCPKCKSNQDAIKKLDISRLPSILVVHFKRFFADPDTMSTVYRKKQTLVKFPLSELNMSRYLARTEVNRNKRLTTFRYHLYGVSNHYGSMESGHYTAFCLNNIHQKWFKFDDYNVSSIDASDVQASAAYILFYSCLPDRPQSDVR
uniref:Ubiquitin carboxyl-terminal hydrolase n=1 Tax=Anopheles dirus TaxID=7168 RepID=A0A182NZ17_9DIPT